jgi:hypothetical protein
VPLAVETGVSPDRLPVTQLTWPPTSSQPTVLTNVARNTLAADGRRHGAVENRTSIRRYSMAASKARPGRTRVLGLAGPAAILGS